MVDAKVADEVRACAARLFPALAARRGEEGEEAAVVDGSVVTEVVVIEAVGGAAVVESPGFCLTLASSWLIFCLRCCLSFSTCCISTEHHNKQPA